VIDTTGLLAGLCGRPLIGVLTRGPTHTGPEG